MSMYKINFHIKYDNFGIDLDLTSFKVVDSQLDSS